MANYHCTHYKILNIFSKLVGFIDLFIFGRSQFLSIVFFNCISCSGKINQSIPVLPPFQNMQISLSNTRECTRISLNSFIKKNLIRKQ